LAIVIALRRIDRGWKVVLVGGLAGGMLEFAMSLIQQYLLGSRSWNYANEPLNIGGGAPGPRLDTEELRALLGPELSLAEPELILWIRDYLQEQEALLQEQKGM